MAQATPFFLGTWTAADLVARFGAIPLHRVRHYPPPGEATENDVLEIHDHEDRLCELIDGVLVEKTVGNYESYLAGCSPTAVELCRRPQAGDRLAGRRHVPPGARPGADPRRGLHFLGAAATRATRPQGSGGRPVRPIWPSR